jgi:hypothetical protein
VVVQFSLNITPDILPEQGEGNVVGKVVKVEWLKK